MLLALQFLTIIPVKVKGGISEKEVAKSAAFFPVAGAFQGLLALLSASLLLRILPPDIVSGLLVLILTISNGGFHLDGLADTFDALSVKSGGDASADRQKRLSVMKDSTTGAIGATAIVFSILLKFLLLNNLLLNSSPFTFYSLLFLMPVFSKWIMVTAMYHGTSARQDGLGRIFLNNVGIQAVAFSSLLVITFYVAAAELHLLKVLGSVSIELFVILCVVLYAFGLASLKFCTKRFGGLTGDNLGAISEISELLFLAVTIIWLRRSI